MKHRLGNVWMFVTIALYATVSLFAADISKEKLLLRRDSFQRHLRAETDVRHLLAKAGPTVQAAATGYSYMNIIPFVTRENGRRTNLGLNNFSQLSFVRGTNPSANVLIILYDLVGDLAGGKAYVVRTNELLQINDVISDLGSSIGTGWLFILSDEPLSAWASVISNSTNDPSILLSIPWQLAKPSGYTEGIAYGFLDQRLMIQSSVKSGTFQSSLVVVNLGSQGGNFSIKIYDNAGNIISAQSAFISDDGMYVNNDIRSSVSGTFGQIVIEPVSDSLRLVASSFVTSSTGNGAFFPAFALPSPDTKSLAGVWQGSMTGGLTNAQVQLTLFQERSMLYGILEVLSGTFPTTTREFLIAGEVTTFFDAILHIQDFIDSDSALSWISLRFFGDVNSAGTRLEGDTLYTDEQKRQNLGTFSLSRTGDVLPN